MRRRAAALVLALGALASPALAQAPGGEVLWQCAVGGSWTTPHGRFSSENVQVRAAGGSITVRETVKGKDLFMNRNETADLKALDAAAIRQTPHTVHVGCREERECVKSPEADMVGLGVPVCPGISPADVAAAMARRITAAQAR